MSPTQAANERAPSERGSEAESPGEAERCFDIILLFL